MEVTLKINGLDLSSRLSTYTVAQEISYRKVIKTLDDVEHAYPGEKRPIIRFSLFPGTGEQDAELYDALESLIVTVVFTQMGVEITRKMRLTSNLESVFLLKSVDGKRRYRGGEITLRGM